MTVALPNVLLSTYSPLGTAVMDVRVAKNYELKVQLLSAPSPILLTEKNKVE